jgi:hypothetical protein
VWQQHCLPAAWQADHHEPTQTQSGAHLQRKGSSSSSSSSKVRLWFAPVHTEWRWHVCHSVMFSGRLTCGAQSAGTWAYGYQTPPHFTGICCTRPQQFLTKSVRSCPVSAHTTSGSTTAWTCVTAIAVCQGHMLRVCIYRQRAHPGCMAVSHRRSSAPACPSHAAPSPHQGPCHSQQWLDCLSSKQHRAAAGTRATQSSPDFRHPADNHQDDAGNSHSGNAHWTT